jgi:tRNA (guanine-N7-)-methyltransferase
MPQSTDNSDDTGAPHELRSFGRKRGRKLSPRQDALFAELLPKVAVDLGRPLTDVRDLLPAGCSELWLEIGFGGGEHLIWQARENPQALIIGCEPFVEGAAKVLAAIETDKLTNIRVHADDARPLLRWLPAASLSRCFVLFPDPWPKKRHTKRRLVCEPTLALLARAMRPGAQLRLATDIADYARTMLIALQATPHFRWLATSPLDWRHRPPDWPQTRYEAKAIDAGRKRYYLTFTRI